MSRYMTEEEIQAEQELIRKHTPENLNAAILEETAMRASEVSDEDGKKVTPLDLLDSKNYVSKDIRDARYDVCNGCERLFKPTKSCKECGCFMAMKTWLKDARCPLNKW